MDKILDISVIAIASMSLVVSVIVGMYVIESGEKTAKLIERQNEISAQIYNSTNYPTIFNIDEDKIVLNLEKMNKGYMNSIYQEHILKFEYVGKNDLRITLDDQTFEDSIGMRAFGNYDIEFLLNYEYNEKHKEILEQSIFEYCLISSTPLRINSEAKDKFVLSEGIQTIEFPITLRIDIQMDPKFAEFENYDKINFDSFKEKQTINPFFVGTLVSSINVENLNTNENKIFTFKESVYIPFSENVIENISCFG